MWPKLSSNISLPLTTLTLIILFSEILKILKKYFLKLKKSERNNWIFKNIPFIGIKISKLIPMTIIIETNLSELDTKFNGGHHYDNFEHHLFNNSTWNCFEMR